MPETWTPAETSTPVWTPAADDDLTFTSRGTLSSDAVTVLYGETEVSLTDSLAGLGTSLAALDGRIDAIDTRVDVLEAAEYDAQAAELAVAEARGRLSTDPTFALCAPLIDGDHHDFAWQITTPPGDFTTGSYARFDDLVVLPFADVAPSPSTARTYSEIFTQTHDDGTTTPPDDPGVWDNWEDAVERRWDTTNNSWKSSLFFEWTEAGGTTEAHSLSTSGTYDLPDGVPGTYARWLEFSNAGNWRLRWFRRVWRETPTHSFDGADWVLIHTINGTGTTNIDTTVTYPWGFGYGQGSLRCRKITARDVGPAGTVLAEVDAADAAAGGDLAFTDGAGNTVTPGTEASTFTPGSGGGVSLGETSTTAYRGDRGKAAYDHSQVTTGNPHGTTAADVGAAATSHTHAASAIASGTIDIARIPTGTTGTTVPFGNDSRFTDTRTPTDGTVTAAKLDAALAARIPTTVWAATDSAARTTAGAKADDSELKFAGAANTRYRVDMHLQFSGDASADVTIGITGPTGATCSLFMDYFGGAVAAASAVNQAGAHISTVGAAGAVGAGVIASPGLAYRLSGWVQLSSTAGDVSLYWGPTSNGAGTGVIRHANSHLIHTP